MLQLKASTSPLLLVAALFVAGCFVTSCSDTESPYLQGKTRPQKSPSKPVPQPGQITEVGKEDNIEFNNKVDILFVIDNSLSMEDEQYLLAKNINLFVEAIERNPFIDYHIGVVPAYDKHNYTMRQTEEKYELLQEADQHYDVKGYLQPLIDPSSFPSESNFPTSFPYQKTMLQTDHPPYITKDLPNYQEVLKATLFIGVIPWEINGTRVGPIDEEVFSPIVEVLNPTQEIVRERNAGFRRDDAHFVAVIISDADDADGENSSKITPSTLNGLLQKFSGSGGSSVLISGQKKKYSTYGVIVPPGVDNCGKPSAVKEPEAVKIVELLKLTRIGTSDESNAQPWLSLCDPNFGEKLAAIGDEIRLKASDMKIRPSQVPARKSDGALDLRVFYGDREIPRGPTGWQYDPKDNIVIVSANFQTICETPAEGSAEGFVSCGIDEISADDVDRLRESQEEFEIRYTPVDLTGLKKGRTKRLFN